MYTNNLDSMDRHTLGSRSRSASVSVTPHTGYSQSRAGSVCLGTPHLGFRNALAVQPQRSRQDPQYYTTEPELSPLTSTYGMISPEFASPLPPQLEDSNSGIDIIMNQLHGLEKTMTTLIGAVNALEAKMEKKEKTVYPSWMPLGPTPERLPLKTRVEGPRVLLWTRDLWNAEHARQQAELKGSAPTARNEGIKWNFIEGITGEPVTNERKASIRSYCRDFYAHMHNILNATSIKPPKTWDSGADLYWKTHLEYKLETEFPELRYCEEHWKSAYIAVQTYPAFMDELRKKADKIKSEDTEAGPIDVTTNLSQARQPSSISARPATATTRPIGPSTTALGKRRVGNTSAQLSMSGDASQQKRQKLMSSTRANTLDLLWSPSPNPSGCATTPGHTLPASFATPVPAGSARTGSDDHSLNTVPNSSASHATPGSGCLVPAGGTTGSETAEDPESLDTSLGPGPHASQDLLPTTSARPPQATAHIADSLPGVSENPDGIDDTQLDEATIAQAMQTALPLGSAAVESQQALTATSATLETLHATCPEMEREAAAQGAREAVANTAMTTQTQRNADAAGSVSASVDSREPATINVAETSGAVGGASKSTGRAKSRKFSATNAKTPRGFCGREWAQAHPHGTTKEFNAHFDTLSPEELQRYTDLADAEKRAKKGMPAS